jgi:hypothetical protein
MVPDTYIILSRVSAVLASSNFLAAAWVAFCVDAKNRSYNIISSWEEDVECQLLN